MAEVTIDTQVPQGVEQPDPDLEALNLFCKDWISRAESELTDFLVEVTEAENYFDNLQIPSGFSDQHSKLFSELNDPSKRPVQVSQSYIVVNQIQESHERVLGEFSKAKRSIYVYGRGFKDFRKVEPIRKSLELVEDKNRTFYKVVFPCMDQMLHVGLSCSETYYDPFVNPPNGFPHEEYFSCREVLIDPDSKDPFYDDTYARARKIRYRLADARRIFSKIPGFDSQKLAADQEQASTQPARKSQSGEQFCTIFRIYIKERTEEFLKFDKGGGVTNVSADQADQPDVIPDMPVKFRVVLYNKGTGVMWNSYLPYKHWPINLLINRRSEARTYPYGDFTYYKNLQDLFNVIMTVILHEAKESGRWLLGVDPATYAAHGATIERAISEGKRVIPVVQGSQVMSPPGVSESVLTLLSLVKQAIDSVRNLPSVAKGELPAKQISEATVNALLATAMVSHGRKDIMINNFMTELLGIRYDIIVSHWDQQDYVRVTDARVGDPQFIPINMTIVGDLEYQKFLMQMSGIQAADEKQAQEQFVAFKQKFEKENSVEVSTEDRHSFDGATEPQTDKEYEQAIVSSGMTPTDFVNQKNAQTTPVNVYTINKLDADIDADLRYVIDFDIEKNKAQNRALMIKFAEDGWAHPIDAMKASEVDDPEGTFERGQQFKQEFQLAAKIQSNPAFQQAVQLAEQIIANPKLREQIGNLIQITQ